MIGKLKGIVDGYGEDFVILDVGGVGYLVHCSTRTLHELPATGEHAVLAIETYVREDQIRLFGFLTDVEREWFRLLQTVQGVGAKVALAVLGTLKHNELASAIAMRDKAMITRAPGVGPKVAERIVHRAQGQGAGLLRGRSRARALHGERSRSSAFRAASLTPSRRWSISAMASRRPPPRSRRRHAASARTRTSLS